VLELQKFFKMENDEPVGKYFPELPELVDVFGQNLLKICQVDWGHRRNAGRTTVNI
jgi:hypothetical protein